MAALLGKEPPVWLPTGTLANHLAVRMLAGNRRRVLVQAESHLMNDCGDCAETLSGLHLVPLAPGKATFTLAGCGARRLRILDRARQHADRRDPDRISGAPQAGRALRFRGDEEDRRLGARAQRRTPSGWRASLPGERLHRAPGERVHRTFRYGLRLHVQVFQRGLRRDARRPEGAAGRSLSDAPHVRRRACPTSGRSPPSRCIT